MNVLVQLANSDVTKLAVLLATSEASGLFVAKCCEISGSSFLIWKNPHAELPDLTSNEVSPSGLLSNSRSGRKGGRRAIDRSGRYC